MLDWFCAEDGFVLGRNPRYRQACILCQDSSLKMVGVNMYDFNKNLPLSVMQVRSIHWINGTNNCRVGSVIMRQYASQYTLPERALPSLPLGLSNGFNGFCMSINRFSAVATAKFLAANWVIEVQTHKREHHKVHHAEPPERLQTATSAMYLQRIWTGHQYYWCAIVLHLDRMSTRQHEHCKPKYGFECIIGRIQCRLLFSTTKWSTCDPSRT